MVWKQPFTVNELAGSFNPVIQDSTVVYSNFANQSGINRIIALNTKNGAEKWTWGNNSNQSVNVGGINTGYSRDEFLYISSNRGLFSVNILDGLTNFSVILDGSDAGETFYIDNLYAYLIYERILDNKEMAFVVEISLTDQSRKSVYTYVKRDAFRPLLKLGFPISHNSTDYVLIANNLVQGSSPAEFKFIVLLVETKTKKVIWEKSLTGIGTIARKPVLYKGSVFVAHSSIHRLDLDDGSIIWEKEIEGGVGFAGMIMADGKLVIGTEGLKPMHHALDPETGDILWSTRTTGTCSTMEYHNCVIYFTGGGDGKLHALNAHTGEHLYILTSPDYAQNSNLFFGNSLTID